MCTRLFAVAVVMSLTVLAGGSAGASETAPRCDVSLSPGRNVQQALNGAPPGSVICLERGIHRLSSPLYPKTAQALVGESGSVLSGARALDGFLGGAGIWMAQAPQTSSPDRGLCAGPGSDCTLASRVFFDDVPLMPAASRDDLSPNEFFLDPAASAIYLSRDPEGHRVEIATPGWPSRPLSERLW